MRAKSVTYYTFNENKLNWYQIIMIKCIMLHNVICLWW